MVKRLLDPNTQKTHYVLDVRQKARKVDVHKTPFCALAQESDDHVKHRYSLYQKVWAHQLEAIQKMLNSANNDLFANLLQYIQDPVGDKLEVMYLALSSNTANNLRVLEDFSAYVAESGEGTHIHTIRLNSRVCFNIKAAIREVVRQVVRGRTDMERRGQASDKSEEELKEEEEEELKEEEEEVEKVEDEEEDEEEEDLEKDDDEEEDEDLEKDEDEEEEDSEKDEDEDEENAKGDDKDKFDGRISYDFGIVQDWAKEYSHKSELRIVVVLEDSDGFSNEVLNQLVQLFCVYSTQTPLKLVMALSTKNVGNWINSNITGRLRTLVASCKLVARENKDIGFQVINDILLQNEITPENPLLLDAQLSLIILSRFENSNNSIDSLISELKFAYMTHFYQLPLAALVDPVFVPAEFHFGALRKLPSFKTHLEFLLSEYKSTEGPDSKRAGQYIRELVTSNKKLHELFLDAKAQFQRYQNAVMNAVHLVYFLARGERHRFQIYKLVTNNQLINSVFLSDTLKRVLGLDSGEIAKVVKFANSELIDRIGDCTDDDAIQLKSQLASEPEEAVQHVTHYLHSNKNLNMKISDNLFNEVLTINGGTSEADALRQFALEENYENLMILVIRPKLREIIESGLDEPQKYLRNALVLADSGLPQHRRLAGPPLAKLYNVYKDAPVNINIWDFYVAFRLSLPKHDILTELEEGLLVVMKRDEKLKESELLQKNGKKERQNDIENLACDELREVDDLKELSEVSSADGVDVAQMEKLKELAARAREDDAAWNKLVYAWFLQSCFELTSMGFLREKSKGDYVEKMVWKSL